MKNVDGFNENYDTHELFRGVFEILRDVTRI